jgi:cobalt-zinc-cadmium efflux system outer membrane protein
MVYKTRQLFFLASTLLIPTLTFAQTPASSSPDMQNMPGMQMPADQKPSATQPQDLQNMPGMKMNKEMPGMQMDDQSMKSPMQGPTLKLSDLEQMALSRNPTISQVNANLRAAEGAKRQAGLYPNPTAGYYGDEIRGGSYHSGKQGAFVNQTIVFGGKLGAARRTAEQDRLLALNVIDSQRYRILTDVRTLYYEALTAQRLVSLRRQLLILANDAVQTSYQLGNVGQADRPDVLQSEVEGDQAKLDLESAQQDQQSVWRTLGAVVGNPDLPMSPLEGNLEDIPQLNEQEWMTKILSESPQVKSAQQDAERAKASLVEAKKVSIPDLQISANVSQDNEPLEPTTHRVGIVSGAQIGMQLPIFNHNQGNVERAKADLERSQQEVQRVQLELRRQMSTIFRDYGMARTSAERYRTSMLPRAQKAYDLYKTSYENMAAAYPQVLISQRTLFQLQVDYIRALETVWMNATAIQGYTLSDGLSAPSPLSGGVPQRP